MEKEEQVPPKRSPERAKNPGAGPGNPGTILGRKRSPGATEEREERLAICTKSPILYKNINESICKSLYVSRSSGLTNERPS